MAEKTASEIKTENDIRAKWAADIIEKIGLRKWAVEQAIKALDYNRNPSPDIIKDLTEFFYAFASKKDV